MGASAPIAGRALSMLFITGTGSAQGYPIHSFNYQEFTMNKDQAKGRVEEAKGKVKEVAGRIVGNEKLELKGKIENTAGKVQAAFGDAKADLKKAVYGK